jgi:hypothetical protein
MLPQMGTQLTTSSLAMVDPVALLRVKAIMSAWALQAQQGQAFFANILAGDRGEDNANINCNSKRGTSVSGESSDFSGPRLAAKRTSVDWQRHTRHSIIWLAKRP